MNSSFPRLRGALLALSVLLASSCTAKDENATSILPKAPPSSGAGTVRGSLIAVGAPPPKVEIKIFQDGLTLLSSFTTSSLASGRWSVSGLPSGSYRFQFTPPTPDPTDPTTNLRTVQVGSVDFVGGDLVLPPIVFAPVENGGMLINDNNAAVQTLQFRVDPLNLGSAIIPGLENMQFLIRANANLQLSGFTLTQLDIDDDTSNTGRDLLIEIAIIRADQLPAPHVDAEGNSLTSQVYYALYPAGFDFLTASLTPNELEIDYPNVNGLTNVFTAAQLSFSQLTGTWESAGIGDVSSDGLVVDQVNFDGTEQTGIVVSPGPPPPRTRLVGTVKNGGMPLLREGISVLTNSGFRGTTDALGVYSIEDVPIPLNRADLVATAYADDGLVFATASASARPIYPQTVIDIELSALVLAAPNCDLANSEPAEASIGNETNERIRLRFDAEMDPDSLQGAITVLGTPDGLDAVAVTGTVATRDFAAMGGVVHTDAFFLPDVNLPASATVVISVSTAATNTDGIALAAACTLTFRTGTSTLFLPRIDLVEPALGTIDTSVTLRGVNLDLATLTFDGSSVTPTSQTTTKLVFGVPSSEGTEAPGTRVIQLEPGSVTANFDLLPRIDVIQIDTDPDMMVEVLAARGSGFPGTSVAGVDQNDGTLMIISGQNLFDSGSGMMPSLIFGRGDGNPTGATDGDAAIDGPDETAAEQRIDVNVPPQATTGILTVTVDDGMGSTFTSPPATFVIELPEDQTAPVIDMGTLDPLPNATGVLTSKLIHVEFGEPVAGTSRLLVGFGVPLRQLPGTTAVTTSLDGSIGILEFSPTDGALPLSTTIQVQVSSTAIVDLAGNEVANFNYTFTTGTTKPTGGVDPDRGTTPGVETGELLALEQLEQLEQNSATDSANSTESGFAILRALELGGSVLQQLDGPDSPGRGEPIRGISALVLDSEISVQDGSVADWGLLPAVARWSTEFGAHSAIASSLYVAEHLSLDGEGQKTAEAFLRFGLSGGMPDPERHVYRFRIADENGSLLLTGLVSDLDEDGQFELSLFRGPELRPTELARSDLVQVGRDFLEIGLPARRPFFTDRSPVRLRIDSLDLQLETNTSSPELQFELY